MQAETTQTAHRGRGGRPRKDAGDVDRRILDAATSLFLQQGFDATSCEQVVAQASAGKASLYARYANKDELFAAVVRDLVERTPAPTVEVAGELPVRARLQAAGRIILTYALAPEVIAFTRVVLATAERMPDVARLADQIGRDRAVQCVAAAITGRPLDKADEMGRALLVASKFIDLAFVPIQMRALLGDDAQDLASGVDRRVDDAIDLLASGGWLNVWE